MLLSAKDMIFQIGSDNITSCPRYDESACPRYDEKTRCLKTQTGQAVGRSVGQAVGPAGGREVGRAVGPSGLQYVLSLGTHESGSAETSVVLEETKLELFMIS